MCCKEERQRILRQAKMNVCMKACKARKKSSLRQRRRRGRRVLRNHTRGNMGIKATWTMGSKRIAVNSNCHEIPAELCSEVGRIFGPRPMEDFSSVVVKEENLARETDIESLPLDILVHIVCSVRHDELKPLFHVSSKFREAALIARQMHFNYTTPVRVQGSRKRANSSIPNESSKKCSRFEGFECFFRSSKSPATPNAPKQVGKFQKPEILSQDMKGMATLLFSSGTQSNDDTATFATQNHFLRSFCTTNRVLFVEDELCNQLFETDCKFRVHNPVMNSGTI